MNEHSVGPAAPTRAEHAAGMAEYLRQGERLAREAGNRGPVRLDAQGELHPNILDAYWEKGFYVFERVIGRSELDELRADADNMIERAPVRRDAGIDARGRPALGRDFARDPYTFIKPLSDPWGGTEVLGGRHPSQMTQPAADTDAPEDVLFLMHGMCQAMPSGLRLYGHPALLAIAEAINGEDFVPFNDAIFVKQPGLGGSVAWHQDGVTHWNSPNWDEGIHGFNFQVQLYPSTPGNCLWVMPGTHKDGHIDIKRLVRENGGSERLPGAVPLTCGAGDVTMVNRQALHGSFANTSPDLRISLTFGFHRRASVLGQKGALSMKSVDVYDEQRIFDRSAVIAVAIDARRRHHPDETPFRYRPFAGLEDDYRMTEATFERVIRDYNLKDLAI
ncbi:MAG: phytanoyl-CoA dioxygenase family protein [Alphaproteobacteria bacterium]|jgi:ectoine hydroxylase-related dioxygenase (phytanoyl-CoA dioxygenase family)|nr:phytanoyl-CoA dioxygenase family protein [Alphaproteobacteria bacterium]MDP6812857.1 phytanoyl-CoA dioxygenase family protein [Alphaproteobacteria bacterium]